jgi:cytochrome P450
VVAVPVAVLAVALVLSLPYWLPRAVVAARMRLFGRISGEEGVTVPGKRLGVEHFRRLYADPAADGRSRGAGLSDLFWYWLAPGPQVHQEHLEPGERYDEVARTTRRILAQRLPVVERLAATTAAGVLDELPPGRRAVRLRDLAMPIWADYFYRLVFEEDCPPEARKLIVGNADDVVSALKCLRLRHLGRRDRLTRYLLDRLDDVPHSLPSTLDRREKAWYLQGAFFNTAVVQMSEATAHVLMAVATHPAVQQRLSDAPGDDGYLDRVLDEAFRRWPLFGIAHRIASADIEVPGHPALPAGTVLCFSYPDFHAAGFTDPDRFDPDRWLRLSTRDANHIPFGVTANRACPARGLAPPALRAVVRAVLARYTLDTAASHTRSLPNRGPCLLTPLGATRPGRLRRATMRAADRWSDLGRSLTQLVLGTWMVLDARRLGLTRRYFADHDTEGRPLPTAPTCPVHGGQS